tara:strand:- start:5551 stop:6594 length:1044 start_codon:yes stop_codon:yes gene_type:complete
MLFEDHQHFIEKYTVALDGLSTLSPADTEKRDLCSSMLKAISDDPKKYDQLAPLNTNWLHNKIVNLITKNKVDQESIDDLMKYLSRVAREATLRQPYVPKPPESELMAYFEFGKAGLTEEERKNSDFIWASLPKYVAMEQLSEIADAKKEVDQSISDWKKELAEIEAKVLGHEENLKKYHQKYNFVGLSKAFHEMFNEKKREKNRIFLAMVVIGALALMPLLLQFASHDSTAFVRVASGDLSAASIGKLISLVGIELILIYFFRIALQNYHSAKSQLLQLDLRQSLCAFIESYVDFAKEKKTKDQDSLSKFEALVFAGISPDATKIPGTFDGIDQIAKLIKEFKSKV